METQDGYDWPNPNPEPVFVPAVLTSPRGSMGEEAAT